VKIKASWIILIAAGALFLWQLHLLLDELVPPPNR
jgi:hypothetical protein